FCPLMGDLRKIRHCIIHHKSIVSDNGLSFEYLKWIFQPGPLNITYEMFREINDAIRGSGMKIHSLILAPELKQALPLMSNKERKSFDEFFNKFENKINSNIWPGMQNFLIKNIEKPGIKELATLSGFNKLVK
ncbi:TPA: hypothetical protein ACSP0N_004161, partial [Aeromonas veronii]